MMGPKPLIPGQREKIWEILCPVDGTWDWGVITQIAREAMQAEAYWREAVKNAAFTHVTNAGWKCHFCDETSHEWDQHKADCPWKLAQE